tara:strand:- start:675 stop:968 length:294 start_codon:yes stop_codon:yes gene_type:complete
MSKDYKIKEDNQGGLFEDKEILTEHEKEWQGMPEFKQDKLVPHATIIVRFRNEEDLQKFATLTDQDLNNKTKSLWFPKLEIQKLFNTRYVDKKKNES